MDTDTDYRTERSVDFEASLEALSRKRRRLFSSVFAAVLVAGLGYTALQERIYRSSATVLMSAPAAIDAPAASADVQNVAIQRRILLGSDITNQLSQQFREQHGESLPPPQLRELLAVTAVPETNLLELSATGGERETLPALVETWIEVYSGVREREISASKAQTLAEVEDELVGLGARLQAARTALAEFRERNGIISMERRENDVLARLDGINKALNAAMEEEVRTKAYLDTLRESLGAGEQVVPQDERAAVAAMTRELTSLRGRLKELKARYTDDYIARDARLRQIPERIEELEQELATAYAAGTRAELDNAERAYRAARDSVVELERRLDEHRAEVAVFNSVYAEHEALAADLQRLEELNREAQARQVQVEISPVEKYPQVSVIDWPTPAAVRVGPDYLLLLGVSLASALAAALFAVWLHSYLNPRRKEPAYVTLSGVHMYPPEASKAVEHLQRTTERLEREDQGRKLEDQRHGDGEDTDSHSDKPS